MWLVFIISVYVHSKTIENLIASELSMWKNNKQLRVFTIFIICQILRKVKYKPE